MEITIRRVTEIDVAKLSSLAKQTFFDTFSETCSKEDMQSFLGQYFSEEALLWELQTENDFCFFAEAEGKPVGYLRFMEDYSSFPLMKKWKALELKRIYILKEYHGKGVAQKLMDFTLAFGRDKGYEVIWLGVWQHNLRAQLFYKKYGFEDSGHTHDFPIGNTPQTDIWMWKFIQ